MNIDAVPLPGVDHVVDLDRTAYLPFPDDSVTVSEGVHVIEHLHDPLPLMQELWRVTQDGGTATFRCPYGSSDDADEDPTHVRRMFLGSWRYFGQPAYWRADYGYRGDWEPEKVVLRLQPWLNDIPDDQVMAIVRTGRNAVQEMVATLRAIKPAREPLRDLQGRIDVTIERSR